MTTSPEQPPRKPASPLKITIRTLLLLIVLAFVYLQFRKNWDQIVDHEWTLDWTWLLLSFAGHLLTLLLFSRVWCSLILGMGYRVSLRNGFKISYVANLGRYIPGKIWPVFGMLYLARGLGIPEPTAMVSWIIAQLFALPSAFLVALICIGISPELHHLGDILQISSYLLMAATIIGSAILIFAPNLLFGWVNRLLARFKRPPIVMSLSVGRALLLYVGYALSWVAYGLSFWLFLKGILPGLEIGPIVSIGIFVMAYQLGYLALFAPGGVGIRELAMSGLLQPIIGPTAVVAAVAARLWNLAAEIGAALTAGFLVLRDRKTKGAPSDRT